MPQSHSKPYKCTEVSLEKYLPYHHTDWLHTRLADVYFLQKNYRQAFDHYTIATNINPNYESAINGIQRVEKQLSGNEEDSNVDEEEMSGMSDMNPEEDPNWMLWNHRLWILKHLKRFYLTKHESLEEDSIANGLFFNSKCDSS